jgi:hypothetical protein
MTEPAPGARPGLRAPALLGLGAALGLLALRVARTWFLCDDAFISFRYVRNLLLGRGLVWNVGEAVEGYTNLLWVLQLAAIQLVTGVRPEHVAAALGVAWTGVTLALIAALGRVAGRPGAGVLAVALIATNRSFAIWSTGGLETRSFTALVVATVLGAVLAARGRVGPEVPSLLAGLAALSRPEGALLGAALIVAWPFLPGRDPGAISLGRATAPFAAIVGAHLAWRWSTYHALVPNTAIAKVDGAWWEGGLRYLAVAGIEHGLWVTVPLAATGTALLVRRGARGVLVGAVFAVGQVVALAYAGGDHFEHRLLDPVFALLAVPAADALLAVGSPRSRAALVAATLVVSNVIPLAEDLRVLRDAPDTRYEPAVAPEVDDHPWLLAVPGVGRGVGAWIGLTRWCIDHAIGTRWPEHAAFGRKRVAQYACWEEATDQGLVPEDAVVAERWIGAAGYYLKDTIVVDVHGLTDATVARSPVQPQATRQLAHAHEASGAYLHARGVNAAPAGCTDRLDDAEAPYALRVRDGVWAPLAFTDAGWLHRPAWAGRLERVRDAAGEPVPVPYPALQHEQRWTDGPRPWFAARRLTSSTEQDDGGVIVAWYGPGPALAWTRARVDGDRHPYRRTSSPFPARRGERLGLHLPGAGDVEVGVLVDGVEVATVGRAATVAGRATVDLDAWAGRPVRLESRADQPDGDAPLLAVLLLDRPAWEHQGEPGWDAATAEGP